MASITRMRAALWRGLAASMGVLCLAAGGCMPGLGGPSERTTVVPLTTMDHAGRELAYLAPADPRFQNPGGGDELVRVIYIHGTPGRGSILDAYIAEPVPGTAPVAVDRLGFGESNGAPVVSFREQAHSIATLLDPRPDYGTILVGHSLGGPIAARLAAEYPDRVTGLVIVAGSLAPDLEKPRWFNHAAAVPFVDPLLPRALRMSNRELLAAPDQARALDRVVGRVRAATVVIHGTHDTLVPVENVHYMRDAMTGARSFETDVIDGGSHFLPWTHEELIRRRVRELVEAEQARRRARAEDRARGGTGQGR